MAMLKARPPQTQTPLMGHSRYCPQSGGCRKRATGPIEDICCEKIRSCSCSARENAARSETTGSAAEPRIRDGCQSSLLWRHVRLVGRLNRPTGRCLWPCEEVVVRGLHGKGHGTA